MKNSLTPALKSALTLTIFTVVCIAVVYITHDKTKTLIAQNIAQVLLNNINELVPDYENDIISDKINQDIKLYDVWQNITIYQAKKSGKTVSYLINYNYPNGYSGNIQLLSAISSTNEVLGTRVITHKETPGLGDGIQTNKSNWIKQLSSISLTSFGAKAWSVKKDGGNFDQLTGATITSRAVINAVYELLLYLKNNPDILPQ